ncbi:MAG: trigger factor [Deltaproteobacteria bacterium]|nr:trigger factor [Deltaproteobacteria bacterium]
MSPSAKEDAAVAEANDEIRIETEEVSAVVRSIGVTVSQERVRRAFETTYRQLGRTASVRGFRKGKVPRSVLEKLYGASIPEEIERVLVQETIQAAVEKSGLIPMVQPEVEAGPPQPNAEFEYTLRIEVKPEIELPELEGLPAKAPKIEVKAEEIEEELERMRQNKSPWIEEDEDVVVDNGHQVTFDYEGRVDGELFEGGAAENTDLEIGSGRMIPGFEEGLVGAKAQENVTLKVKFPEDYGAEHLAGKDAEFSCTVHTIKRKHVPELDDEFAKDVGEFETLDELREKITGDFTARAEQAAETAVQRSVMDSLLERTDFEVPPGVVEQQLNSQIQSMQQQFQGQIPPDILQQQLSRMREEGRGSAERRVRESLVLEAIVKAQGLEVSAEDLDARFAEMAESQGMDVNQLKQMAAQQGWGEAIGAELLDKKALAFLASGATVEEEEQEEAAADSESAD